MKGLVITLLVVCSSVFAIPNPPTDPDHPGYATRTGAFDKVSIDYIREGSFLFLPKVNSSKVPLVVFSHGQALGLKNYELLFERFASKGIAVFYPQYDRGFFDTNWERMGADYDKMVLEILKNYPQIDRSKVVYSGHSKGGYVGLMAIAHRGQQNIKNPTLSWSPIASLFYSPAGFEEEALAKIDVNHPVHLVWPQDDSIIDEELIDEIYEKLPVTRKQKIVVQGYDGLEAGHFFPLTRRAIFGGRNGISPFHFYGILPWTFGAIFENEFLYGDLATDSGDSSKPHLVLKSF